MENLTWGFVRPKRPTDRSLAYAQSYWICTYIEQTYGHDAVLRMMAEFKNGQRQEDVFPKVLGRSMTQFTSEFFAWTRQQVATWGYDAESSAKYDALRAQAEDLIKAKQYAKALPLWQEIAKLRPVDALPHQRLAGLYLTREINQKDKAIEHLIALHKVELHDNRYAKRIARLYRDLGQMDDAAKYGLEAVHINPYDADAHELLAELYEASGNEKALARERDAIERLKVWSEQNEKQSAISE
jgi:tetratricopeptide (TPR) repeat protein